MPKTPLPDDLARRLDHARDQIDRIDRSREPWAAVRDQLIAEAKRAGCSARAVAEAAGVSHTYVAQLDASTTPAVDELKAAGLLATLWAIPPEPPQAIYRDGVCVCTEPPFDDNPGAACPDCGHLSIRHSVDGCTIRQPPPTLAPLDSAVALSNLHDCPCLEPSYSILGDTCPHCHHPTDDHAQQGCRKPLR